MVTGESAAPVFSFGGKVDNTKKSMRRRTFFLLLAGILILVLAFTGIFYSYFSRIYRDRLEEEQKSLVSHAVDTAESLLMNIRQNAYYLCSNEDLANMLVNSEGTVANQQIETLGIVFSLNTGTPTAPLMQSAYPILLLDSQFPLSRSADRFSIRRSMTTRHIYSSEGMENEDWYAQTLALKGQIYAFCDERNKDYLFFSHLLSSTRIADPRYNDKIGVVLYAMPMLRLNRLLAESKFNDRSCVILLYRDTVMACTDEGLFPAGQPLEGISALPASGTVGKTRLNNTRYSVTQARFQRDWQCVLLVPEKGIVYQEAPFYLLALLLLLLVAVVLALSLIVSRQVIRPIVRLSGIMEQAKDAEHMPPAQETGPGDEITVLYQSYNAMRQRIQTLSRKTLEEQKKLRASELKTMQAQINPHFIYNTLDSISCSALMEGNDSIVTMVASLINILKYSINFSRTTVPLREEINYLEDYICIQQIRFAGGFTFEYDIPERYMSVLVSPIILQPLVENSLFHAGNQDGGLRIRLYCEEKDGYLLIHVTDNGSAGNADRINGYLTEGDALDSHGIGIRNVYRRITLLSGGRGGLHYVQLPDGGLDAIVCIPLQGVLAELGNEEDEGTGGTD